MKGRRQIVQADPPGDLSLDDVLTARLALRLLDLRLARGERDHSDPPEGSLTCPVFDLLAGGRPGLAVAPVALPRHHLRLLAEPGRGGGARLHRHLPALLPRLEIHSALTVNFPASHLGLESFGTS